MISTQIAADIMNCAFKTELCMFKVNKSEFNVIMAITSQPVEASKNDQNTRTNKYKMIPLKEHFLKLEVKCSL